MSAASTGLLEGLEPSISDLDLDLESERARVRCKGGDIEWLLPQSGSVRLVPFLADRRPALAPGAGCGGPRAYGRWLEHSDLRLGGG